MTADSNFKAFSYSYLIDIVAKGPKLQTTANLNEPTAAAEKYFGL